MKRKIKPTHSHSSPFAKRGRHSCPEEAQAPRECCIPQAGAFPGAAALHSRRRDIPSLGSAKWAFMSHLSNSSHACGTPHSQLQTQNDISKAFCTEREKEIDEIFPLPLFICLWTAKVFPKGNSSHVLICQEYTEEQYNPSCLLLESSYCCCSFLWKSLSIPWTRGKSEWFNAKISFPKKSCLLSWLLSVLLCWEWHQQCSLKLFCAGVRASWCLHGHQKQGTYGMWVSHADREHPNQVKEKEFPSHSLWSTHTWAAAPFFGSLIFPV